MKDGRSGIATVVDNHSVTACLEPAFYSELLRDKEQMTDKLPVRLLHAVDVLDMLFRHDQNVRWRLGIDVFESNGQFVLVDQFGRYLFFDDLAEDAIRIMNHVPSLPIPVRSS